MFVFIFFNNRFHYEGIWRDKITTNVDFPLEGFDMKRYISGPRTQQPYDLYAVSVSCLYRLKFAAFDSKLSDLSFLLSHYSSALRQES